MSDAGARPALPRRDWILLPLVAIATALAFLIVTEGVSRLIWPENKIDRCSSEQGAPRPKPNCVSRDKAAEGPWAETRFNECGYRGSGSCRALGPGMARMAVLGSSISWGYMIPFEDLWSVKAVKAVAARCGKAIDVQSLGGFGNLSQVAARTPEAIALHPQLVALVVAPFDLSKQPKGGFDPVHALQAPPPPPPDHSSLRDRVRSLLSDSRAATIALHYIYGNAETYTSSHLRYDGDASAYLRAPMPKAWRERLDVVDAAVAYITQRLKPTGAPLLLVYSPSLLQADLIAGGKTVSGVDPDAIDQEMARIAKRNGALFADGGKVFFGMKNAPDYFYRADGHPNSGGQALLGRAAADAILAGAPSALCQATAQ